MRIDQNIRRIAAIAVIPFFLALIGILLILHIPGSFEPPYVFPILDTIFTGLIPLIIAAIAFSSYRRRASLGVLLIGVGMLVFGLACIVAPLTAGLPDGRNTNITIHNTGALACAACQLFGGAVLLSGIAQRIKDGRAEVTGAVYGIAILLLGIFIGATIAGITPVFFEPGIGVSVTRQLVIAGAIAFFGIASFLFALAYMKQRGEFLFWYAIGLGLLATGLLSAVAGIVAGDPFSWTARIAQYIGCSFLLVAVIALSKEARQENIPIGDAMSRFFGESREGYEMLVSGNPDAIVVVQGNRFLFANDSALRLYGAASLDELKTKNVLDLVDPGDRFRIAERFEQITSGRNFVSGEIRIVKRDGTLLDVSARASPIRYAGGSAILVTLRDISERKRAERTIADEKERLDALIRSIPDEVWFTDPEKNFTFANPAALRMFGLPEGTDVDVRDFVNSLEILRPDGTPRPQEDAQPLRALRGEVISGEEEMVRIPATGELRVRLVNAAPFKNSEGKIIGSVSVVRDITDRNKAEEALYESRKRLELTLGAVAVGTFEVDLTTGSGEWNAVEYDLLGLRPGSVLSSPEMFFSYVHPLDLPKLRAQWEDAKKTGILDAEFRIIRADGQERWLAGKGRFLFADQDVPGKEDVPNTPLRFLGVNYDITGHKMAEEALRQKQAEIQALFENIPAGLVLFDATPPYTVLVHNRYYQELFNEPFRSGGMAGLKVYEYAPRVEAAGVVAVFDEVARSQQPKQFLDFPYRSDPPNERWFNWYVRPIVIDGKTVSLVSMSLDVTKWHRAKEEVQKARDELESRVQERTEELKIAFEKVGNERQRLYDVLESIPAMVCLLTPDFRIAFANRSFRDRFDESVVGKVCHEVRFGNTDPCPFCESFEVLKTGRPHSWEVTTSDGTVISAHDFPFTDIDGTKMILEMNVDITESRKMEEKIRQISAYNRNLIEASLDPLVTIRPDGKIGDVNEATIRVTGHSREELIGTDFSRYFTDPGQAEAGYLAAFRDGSVTDFALEIRHRDGRVIPVLYNASVFRDARGDVAGVFAAARDITEQKKAQEELKKSHDLLESRVRERTAELARRNDELAAAEEELRKNNDELARNERKIRDALAEKEVLLAEIHHRVKNNLSAFISLLSLEGSYDTTPAGIAMKNDLQNRARSMALIHETLYRTYQFSSVDMQIYLTTLVDQIIGSYRSRISVDAFVHAEGISLDLGRATPAGLIVNELVTNSLKYAFPADFEVRPTIEVEMKKDNGKYFLRVRDNGIGLPRDFTIESTKTLGIKLVNFLARHQMRATIAVNSSNGTEFVFTFAEEQKNPGGSRDRAP